MPQSLKVLMAAAFMILSPSVDAAEAEIKMICSTEWPTTTFEVRQKGDKVNVKLTHHNGAKYAPFHDSLLVPNDITEMKARADMILKLGDEWNFNFKRSECKAAYETYFVCMGNAEPFEINGLKVEPWSLIVTELNQKNMLGIYEQQNVALSFKVNKKDYRISMNYASDECKKIEP